MAFFYTNHDRPVSIPILSCWTAGLLSVANPAAAVDLGATDLGNCPWLVVWGLVFITAIFLGYMQQNRMVKRKTAELRRELFERQMAEKELLASDQRLRQSLSEKEALLKEIHHRVKNNLQIVSSLLYLQEDAIQDPTGLEILRESQNRVKSMALIHEQLYGTDNLAKIDFGRYLYSLTANLLDAYGIDPVRLRLNIEAAGIALGVDLAAPCGLIVNELVSNAIKHAFPQDRGGTIEIIIRKLNAGQMELVVADDGVGLNTQSPGPDSTSLGLRLIDTLTTQLDGTLSVETENGTRFIIIINIPEANEKGLMT